MVQPTPWRMNEDRQGGTTPPSRTESAAAQNQARLRAYISKLSGNWGYLCAAVGSLVTLILLFQPWITASGADGRARVNAFGRMQVTTAYLNVWSQAKPRTAQMTSIWAILASAAIVVTVFTVAVNLGAFVAGCDGDVHGLSLVYDNGGEIG